MSHYHGQRATAAILSRNRSLHSATPSLDRAVAQSAAQRGLPDELVAGALVDGFAPELLEADGAVLEAFGVDEFELVGGAFAGGAGVWPGALEVGGALLGGALGLRAVFAGAAFDFGPVF